MFLHSAGYLRCLIAIAFLAMVLSCASARLTANSVPIPVLLAGPSHKQLPKEQEILNEEVKTSFQQSGYRQETWTKEGSNKFSGAILDLTNGSDSVDVHISKMQVGVYSEVMNHYKVWIGVQGGIDSIGKAGKK
jgi:hypothetical protein